MLPIVLLDAGVVGLACSSPRSSEVERFARWFDEMLGVGVDLWIPDIARYEVRRELLRLNATRKLDRLDKFCDGLALVSVTLEAWEVAGYFWATVRRMGRPTADPNALDADAILAGVAVTIEHPGQAVIVATTNVRHLSWFPGVDARFWDQIQIGDELGQ